MRGVRAAAMDSERRAPASPARIPGLWCSSHYPTRYVPAKDGVRLHRCFMAVAPAQASYRRRSNAVGTARAPHSWRSAEQGYETRNGPGDA